MYSKVMLFGTASPPDFLWNDSGELVAILAVRTSEDTRDFHTPTIKRAEYHRRVVVIGSRAEMLRRRLLKDCNIFVEGQLRDGTWLENGHRRAGAEIYITPNNGTIRFLDKKYPSRNLANGTGEISITDIMSEVPEGSI